MRAWTHWISRPSTVVCWSSSARAEHRFRISISAESAAATALCPVEVGDGVVVIEGIHALNPRLTALLPEGSAFKIYAGMREEYSPGRPAHSAHAGRAPGTPHGAGPQVPRPQLGKRHFSMWPAVCEGEDKNIKGFQTRSRPAAGYQLFLRGVLSCALLSPRCRGELAPGTPYAAQLESLCSRFCTVHAAARTEHPQDVHAAGIHRMNALQSARLHTIL